MHEVENDSRIAKGEVDGNAWIEDQFGCHAAIAQPSCKDIASLEK